MVAAFLVSMHLALVAGSVPLTPPGMPDHSGKPADRSCSGENRRRAIEAFGEGLRAFELRDWPTAIRELSAAAERECVGESAWVPLYGRWRYRFEPQVYLGLALSHLADCRTDCKKCSAVDDDAPGDDGASDSAAGCTAAWGTQQLQLFPASSVERSKCWQGRCAKVGNAQLDCPAVGWFFQMEKAGAPVRAAGSQALGSDCAEIATPVEWLWEALRLRGGKGPNELICGEMLEELDSVALVCREPAP